MPSIGRNKWQMVSLKKTNKWQMEMHVNHCHMHCTLCSPSLFLYKSIGFLSFLSNNPTLASGIYTTKKRYQNFVESGQAGCCELWKYGRCQYEQTWHSMAGANANKHASMINSVWYPIHCFLVLTTSILCFTKNKELSLHPWVFPIYKKKIVMA